MKNDVKIRACPKVMGLNVIARSEGDVAMTLLTGNAIYFIPSL